MKANEYKAWYRRNDPESARRGLDEFNRPFGERYERPPEYSFGSEVYPQYPEMVDISEKQEAFQKGEEEKKKDSHSSDQSQKQERMKKMRGNSAARSVVSAVAAPTAGIVVGAVILVSGYQAIENQAIPELPPIVTTIECDWGEAFDSATITLTDENGTFIAELPATVNTEVTEATCTQAGSRTYTASAVYEGETYSEEHIETIEPAGHVFGEGKVVQGENGSPVMEYECDRCHEKVTVEISVTEEDD